MTDGEREYERLAGANASGKHMAWRSAATDGVPTRVVGRGSDLVREAWLRGNQALGLVLALRCR